MVLDTTAEVEEIVSVRNDANEVVPPRSDDFRHIYGSGIDLTDPYVTETTAPDRSESVVIHVDGWGANGGTVTLTTLDPDGNAITSRGPADNSAYESDSGEDILVNAVVASPFLKIEIAGDGPVNASVYIR